MRIYLVFLISVIVFFVTAGTCPYPEPLGCPNSTINMTNNTLTGDIVFSGSTIRMSGDLAVTGDITTSDITVGGGDVTAGVTQTLTLGNTQTLWISDTGNPTFYLGIGNPLGTYMQFSYVPTTSTLSLVNVANFIVGSYTRHVQIPIVAAQIIGQENCTARNTAVLGSKLDANADLMYLQFEVPNDWDGNNLTVELDWYPAADMANSETVEIEMSYLSNAENEDVDTQTLQSATTATYTSSGVTSTGVMKHSGLTITAAHVAKQDHVHIVMWRDATNDTYNNAAGICATAFELTYTSVGIPTSN